MEKGKRIILTGASGFIGSAVLNALLTHRSEYEVFVLGRSKPKLEGEFHFQEVDLLEDEDRLVQMITDVQAHFFVHLAWNVQGQSYWQAPENALWQKKSLTLVKAFFETGGQRFVGVGTCAEYQRAEWLDEETPLDRGTPYAAAKVGAYEDLKKLATEQTKSWAWGRIYFPFGVGEPAEKLTSTLIAKLKSGQEAPLAEGSLVRHFTESQWLAEALVSLTLSEVSGAVDLVGGEPLSLLEFATLIASKVGKVTQLKPGAFPKRQTDLPFIRSRSKRLLEEVGFSKMPNNAGMIEKMLKNVS